jgi:hypothetical protein
MALSVTAQKAEICPRGWAGITKARFSPAPWCTTPCGTVLIALYLYTDSTRRIIPGNAYTALLPLIGGNSGFEANSF